MDPDQQTIVVDANLIERFTFALLQQESQSDDVNRDVLDSKIDSSDVRDIVGAHERQIESEWHLRRVETASGSSAC